MLWTHLADPLSVDYRISQNIKKRKQRERKALIADLAAKWEMVKERCAVLEEITDTKRRVAGIRT